MEELKDRFKAIREFLGFSQKDFSKRINVGYSTLAMLETGQRTIKDIHISQVCNEFNVNENWLRTGIGEMFIENEQTILSDLSKEYHLDQLDVKIVQGYLALNQEQRQAIKQFVVALAKEIGEEASPSPDLSKEDREEIDAEVESYRAQLLREMTSEKKLG